MRIPTLGPGATWACISLRGPNTGMPHSNLKSLVSTDSWILLLIRLTDWLYRHLLEAEAGLKGLRGRAESAKGRGLFLCLTLRHRAGW